MNLTYLKSLLELTLLTFAVTFLGLITADGFNLLDIGALKAAATAALPAAIAVLYGAFARLLGDFNSAMAVDTRERRR